MNIEGGLLFTKDGGSAKVLIKLCKGEKNTVRKEESTESCERVGSLMVKSEIDVAAVEGMRKEAKKLLEEISELKDRRMELEKEKKEKNTYYKELKARYEDELEQNEIKKIKSIDIVRYVNRALEKQCEAQVQYFRDSLAVLSTSEST
eukprot:TRINITY_DN20676_c0_g1_i2.p1 TRINITY_DN20676_c0_g1~~TRINITY_DN20676_c0_g1_i2.p1  ORF type:complete len:148 (-),score=47.29 TRINITY_DN20676_c0_g1_i2:114-557(-)